MNLGQIVVQSLGLLGRCQGLLRPETVFLLVIHSEASIGNARIRQREPSVLSQRLLVVVDGRLNVLHILLAAHRAATLQVQVIGLNILCRMRRGASRLFAGGLESQSFDNAAIDMVFEGEQILLYSREFLSPHSPAIGNVI